MAIYALVGSDSPTLLESAVKKHFPEHFQIGDGQWLVKASLTTKEVSDKVGDDGQTGMFITIPVTNFWGYHNVDTWEWIKLHLSKE
jgi:hypothetical protein